jgi:hypothetical protein
MKKKKQMGKILFSFILIEREKFLNLSGDGVRE